MKRILILLGSLLAYSSLMAVDPGFIDITNNKTEMMQYVFPEVIVSTGVQTMVMITNPAWNLNAGTTYYSMTTGSVISSDPSKNSMMVTGNGGKYVHALHIVNYWVSISSAVGQ